MDSEAVSTASAHVSIFFYLTIIVILIGVTCYFGLLYAFTKTTLRKAMARIKADRESMTQELAKRDVKMMELVQRIGDEEYLKKQFKELDSRFDELTITATRYRRERNESDKKLIEVNAQLDELITTS